MIPPIRKRLLIFLTYVYLSVCMYVSCMGTLKKSVEDVAFPGAGVVSGYEQHDVGVGK